MEVDEDEEEPDTAPKKVGFKNTQKQETQKEKEKETNEKETEKEQKKPKEMSNFFLSKAIRKNPYANRLENTA
jgi:hypothetical protein